VLIFCSSRKGCESTARHISRFLQKFSLRTSGPGSEFSDVSSAVEALRRCPAGLDLILEQTLPSGVAYHHAGLTVELFMGYLWFNFVFISLAAFSCHVHAFAIFVPSCIFKS
jgi:hypothetical protein